MSVYSPPANPHRCSDRQKPGDEGTTGASVHQGKCSGISDVSRGVGTGGGVQVLTYNLKMLSSEVTLVSLLV